MSCMGVPTDHGPFGSVSIFPPMRVVVVTVFEIERVASQIEDSVHHDVAGDAARRRRRRRQAEGSRSRSRGLAVNFGVVLY